MSKTRNEATAACGAIQVCSGVKGGVEALVHATERVFEAEAPIASQQQSSQPADATDLEEEDPWCTILLDASNAFNEMNRKQALARVRKLWPSAALYLFNCYRGPVPIVLRSRADKRFTKWMHGWEGTSQGCPMAMSFFGIGNLPLIQMLHEVKAHPPQQQAAPSSPPPQPHLRVGLPPSQLSEDDDEQVKRRIERLKDPARAAEDKRSADKLTPGAYADDIELTGRLSLGLAAIEVVRTRGPAFGIRLNASKTKAVVKTKDVSSAQRAIDLSATPSIQVVTSARNLGGVIGCPQAKLEFQKANAEKWAEEVKRLARVAPDNPQAVYTAFTLSQKAKWQYQQRVCKCDDPADVYGVIERAIRGEMIPRLTGWDLTTPAERRMLALPVRLGGMAIDSPIDSAAANYEASLEATAVVCCPRTLIRTIPSSGK